MSQVSATEEAKDCHFLSTAQRILTRPNIDLNLMLGAAPLLDVTIYVHQLRGIHHHVLRAAEAGVREGGG